MALLSGEKAAEQDADDKRWLLDRLNCCPPSQRQLCQLRGFLFSYKDQGQMIQRLEEWEDLLIIILHSRPLMLKTSIWSALQTLYPTWGLPAQPKGKDPRQAWEQHVRSDGYALRQILSIMFNKLKHVTSGLRQEPVVNRILCAIHDKLKANQQPAPKAAAGQAKSGNMVSMRSIAGIVAAPLADKTPVRSAPSTSQAALCDLSESWKKRQILMGCDIDLHLKLSAVASENFDSTSSSSLVDKYFPSSPVAPVQPRTPVALQQSRPALCTPAHVANMYEAFTTSNMAAKVSLAKRNSPKVGLLKRSSDLVAEGTKETSVSKKLKFEATPEQHTSKTSASSRSAIMALYGVDVPDHSKAPVPAASQALLNKLLSAPKETPVEARKRASVCCGVVQPATITSNQVEAAVGGAAAPQVPAPKKTAPANQYSKAAADFLAAGGTRNDWLESAQRSALIQQMTRAEICKRRFESLRPDFFSWDEGAQKWVALV